MKLHKIVPNVIPNAPNVLKIAQIVFHAKILITLHPPVTVIPVAQLVLCKIQLIV